MVVLHYPATQSGDVRGKYGKVYKMDMNAKSWGRSAEWGGAGHGRRVHAIACPDERTVYVAEELRLAADRLIVDTPKPSSR